MTIVVARVGVRVQQGTTFGGVEIGLASGGPLGTPDSFRLDDIAPGNLWVTFDKDADGWGITPEELLAWLALPSAAFRQSATGTGTTRADAVAIRVLYEEASLPIGWTNSPTIAGGAARARRAQVSRALKIGA